MATKKEDKSCARVKCYKAGNVSDIERHNERKNSDYGNVNVEPARIPFNVHFKDPGGKSYMDILREKEARGEISRRGLKADATLFDEMVLDINTVYFEEHGGYEFAKEFYAEAYRFAVKKYGEESILSAVMHADEINLAATDHYGKPVYHYHLHVVAFPVVEKEILWSARCKDKALRGTVKEVIHQISHSKKWPSRTQMFEENGEPELTKSGKPLFRRSYSILQDDSYDHMTEHGFAGFSRGEIGSDAEHLTSLQYQIKKDTERLAEITQRVKAEKVVFKANHEIYKSHNEIDNMGKKTLFGSVTLQKEDFKTLSDLAKEGVSSRKTIADKDRIIREWRDDYFRLNEAYESLKQKYRQLMEYCKDFLKAMKLFPQKVKKFFSDLFAKAEKPPEPVAVKRKPKPRGKDAR